MLLVALGGYPEQLGDDHEDVCFRLTPEEKKHIRREALARLRAHQAYLDQNKHDQARELIVTHGEEELFREETHT